MRNQIMNFLRDELIGPDPVQPNIQPNGEEILVTDPPRLRYGAGVLFPRGVSVERSEDVDTAESTGFEVELAGGNEGINVTKDNEEHEAIEDQFPEEITSLTNAYLPSAIGFSCLTVLSPAGFLVEVRAATYHSEPREYITKSGEIRKGRQFLRIPLEHILEVPSSALEREGIQTWSGQVKDSAGNYVNLEVRILSRPRQPADDGAPRRLLTVALVNCHESNTGRADNSKCFFQVDLRLRAADHNAPFLEYPDREGEPLDEEEDSLRLLYRHRKTYAVGHGCAANWQEVEEGRADMIRSDIIPSYEIKPIVPTNFPDIDLKMFDLSTLGDEAATGPVLGSLCDKYEEWIEQQKTAVDGSDFPSEFRDAALRHLSNCRECLRRMRSGLELLQADPTVRRAFRLSNYAMLLQQLHYGLKLRTWTVPDTEPPQIEPVTWPDLTNPPSGRGSWRPFQIAFILMNLRSIAVPKDDERNIVDLIWFPTGGGKTEAYLGLTAFTIFFRRLQNPSDAGTTVLMRYTLRLLTAQQFQRAASLICACEMIRRNMPRELGSDPITIGLWVGRGLTPNQRSHAVTALNRLSRGMTRENPFIVLQCPWCGAQMGTVKAGDRIRIFGYEKQLRPVTVKFLCKDPDCKFSHGLPLMVIDEEIYESPPTLLIGTVDKFALLPWYPEAGALFGIRDGGGVSPPTLVIQDELHLISGPLGSMVGHYEAVIDELCSREDGERRIGPKIVASTATISRAEEQVRSLYARHVFLFPPQCLRAGDSFFAKEDESLPGRLYAGVHASALPSHVTAQVRVVAALLQATLSAQVPTESERDPYWTLINYFNSLRELGHAATLIRADIREYLNAMWHRKEIRRTETFDERRFVNHFIELTSRISSTEIPESLQKLELRYPPQGDDRPVDICLATNMISVGIDVPRLGLMAVAGQPKTTSEYIQATSRVGRSVDGPGLVMTIYNTSKPRDRSHYERFRSYHASIYRQVEPTSVTPFASPVRERALHALLIALVRYWGRPDNRNRPQPFPDAGLIEKIRSVVEARVNNVDPDELDLTLKHFAELTGHWQRVLPPVYGGFGPPGRDIPLMYPAGSEPLADWTGRSWPTPSSMRNVDASCEAEVIGQYPEPEEEG